MIKRAVTMTIRSPSTPLREYFNDRLPKDVIIINGGAENINLLEPGLIDLFVPRLDAEACSYVAETVKKKYLSKEYSRDDALSILERLEQAAKLKLLEIPETLTENLHLVKEHSDYLKSKQVYITFLGDIDVFLKKSLNDKASALFRKEITNAPTNELAKKQFQEKVIHILQQNGAQISTFFQNEYLCSEHSKIEKMAIKYFDEWMSRIICRENEAASSSNQPGSSSSPDLPALELLKVWKSHNNEARKEWTELVMTHGAKILDWQELLKAALKHQDRGYCEVFWNEFIQVFAHQWGIGIDVQRASHGDKKTTGYYAEYMQLQMAHWLQKYLEQLPKPKIITASSSGATSVADDPWDLLRKIGPDLVEAYKKAALYASGRCSKEQLKQIVEDLRQDKPVVIATGWRGHAVEVMFFPSVNLVAYVNRGNRSYEISSGIRIFEMDDKKQTIANLEEMLFGPYENKRSWIVANNHLSSTEGKRLLENTNLRDNVFTQLRLRKAYKIPLSDQKIGNCTWANTVGSFTAALVMAMYRNTSDLNKMSLIANEVRLQSKDFGAFFRVESAKLFSELYRRYVSTGRRNELKDKEQFKVMSTMVYKSLLKLHNSDFSLDRLEELKSVINNHFNNYEYAMEDCVTALNRSKATAVLHYLPTGSFLFRKSDHGIAYYAISYRGENEVKHVLVKDNGISDHHKGRYTLHKQVPCTMSRGGFRVSDEIGRFSSLSHLLREKQLSFPVDVDSEKRLTAVNRLHREAAQKKPRTEEEIKKAFAIEKINKRLAYLNIETDSKATLYWNEKKLLQCKKLNISPKGCWVNEEGKALRSCDRKKEHLIKSNDLLKLLGKGYRWLYMNEPHRHPVSLPAPTYGIDVDLD